MQVLDDMTSKVCLRYTSCVGLNEWVFHSTDKHPFTGLLVSCWGRSCLIAFPLAERSPHAELFDLSQLVLGMAHVQHCQHAFPAMLLTIQRLLLPSPHHIDFSFPSSLYAVGCAGIDSMLCDSQGWQPETRTYNTAIIACNMCNQSAQALLVRPLLTHGLTFLIGYLTVD